jgi:hypothetical protein
MSTCPTCDDRGYTGTGVLCEHCPTCGGEGDYEPPEEPQENPFIGPDHQPGSGYHWSDLYYGPGPHPADRS